MSISGSDLSQLYAMCGVARCGATRCADHSPLAFVTVDGVLRQSVADGKVIKRSVSISEQEGQGSNSALLTGFDFDPTEGQEVVITLGSVNNGDPIFGGRAQRRTVSQASADAVIFTTIGAVDYVFDANQRLITKRYLSETADAIVADLISTFAPQLSPAGLVSGLPSIDEITFTNESFTGALQRVADRIGGYGRIGYVKSGGKPIVELYLTPTGTNPSELNDTHPTMADFKFSADLSPVKTRVFVEGNGSNSLADVSVGDTLLPVVDVTYFNAFGGLFTSGPQRITYTGISEGGAGSLVGPGLYPASAPGLALASGTGIETGTHKYAYTLVTGAGESLPSPVGSIDVGPVTDPTTAPTVATAAYGSNTNVFTVGGSYRYKYAYLNSIGQTLASTASAAYVPSGFGGGGAYFALVSVPYSTNPDVASIQLLRTKDGGSTYYLVPDFNGLVGLIPNNTAGGTATFTDNMYDTALVTVDPASNTTAGNRVNLSGIAPGAAGVTARKVYRSAANLTQLKLLATIADNTTTTYADSTADASLGANVPTSDTSGLTQPDGQVSAGATSLLLAGTGAFSASGGWAIIGAGLAIRYTGISSGSLTGIPASGAGSITATIPYNWTVTVAPMLTGIPASGDGSIVYAITKGDPVNLIAQVDDLAAQATLEALLNNADLDGIREGFIQDRRLSYTEAVARGTAFLEQRSTAQASVTFTSHDKNTRVGRSVSVDIGSVTNTFKIQSVQISDFIAHGSRANDPLGAEPKMFPKYTVTASNQRYSLEDLLRQLKDRAA